MGAPNETLVYSDSGRGEAVTPCRCICGYSTRDMSRYLNHIDACPSRGHALPPLKRNRLGGLKAPLPRLVS